MGDDVDRITLILLMQAVPSASTYVQVLNYGEIFTFKTEDKLHIEQVREFIGLLIVLIYCTHISIQVYKK